MSIRSRIVALAVGVTIAVGSSLTAVPAEAVTTPYMTTAWVPWSNPAKPTSAGMWTIVKGTRVTMTCWTTGATRLNTGKWFYVVSKSYPYTRGYVPANAVGSQATVGHC